jgi:glycerophosphoryl diester phosphodiesterase
MRIGNNHWLKTTPIAHRGLWNENVIENSLPAYQKAINHNYAIEIDLYLSLDGEIFCFHDKTLERMTGEKGVIFEKTATQLKKLRLLNSSHTIPTFDEVLKLVDGKVPLLIEIKNQPDKSIVNKTVQKLKHYKGEFAIQSFNPLYIKKVKKLAPEFIRGILGTNEKEPSESAFTNFIISKMPLNFLIKPDFISYNHSGLPLKESKIKNKLVIAWTVTEQALANRAYKFADNIIFENFIPKE